LKIRSFIAINLSKIVKNKIIEIEKEMKMTMTNSKVSWVKEENLHITLRFLGNIENKKLELLSKVMDRFIQDYNSFSIKFSKIGAFPGLRKPRVLWVGGETPKLLKDLYFAFNKELEAIGFPEDKPFLPHVTLGRVKYLDRRDVNRLKKFIEDTNIEFEDRIMHIDLMKSELTPKGAIYTVLKDFYLK